MKGYIYVDVRVKEWVQEFAPHPLALEDTQGQTRSEFVLNTCVLCSHCWNISSPLVTGLGFVADFFTLLTQGYS